MTGRAVWANWAKFMACLPPGMLPGLVLLDGMAGPRYPRMSLMRAGTVALAGCALLSTAIFGAALRAGREAWLSMVLPVPGGYLLPVLSEPRSGNLLPLIYAVGFWLLLCPICIFPGARRVGWPRVMLAGAGAFAVALGGMLYVLRVDHGAIVDVLRLLLIALATIGFLPFARMERVA